MSETSANKTFLCTSSMDIKKHRQQRERHSENSDVPVADVAAIPSVSNQLSIYSNDSINQQSTNQLSAVALFQTQTQAQLPTTAKQHPSQQDLTALFECPVCFDYVVPPILQCQNGHLVCQPCRTKMSYSTCPTCRVSIGSLPSIRNLQLERLASTLFFPCKHSNTGCAVKLSCTNKLDHEDSCKYKPYPCPCPGTSCNWVGQLDQVMTHLTNQHKSITTLNGEDIVFLATDINLNGAVDWVMIQSCFNQHFLLVLEKQERNNRHQFFAVVQLIGSHRQAEKYNYKLELNGHRKRLQWEATPRSILDGVQSAISSCDCLVFDAQMAQHFLSPIQKEGANLGINVTITKLNDRPELMSTNESTTKHP